MPLSYASYRNTFAEISLDAIRHNVRAFKTLLNPNCRLMAAVKGDGYGHGYAQTAIAALAAGADCLGVAFADEAIALRRAGIEADILILGHTPPHAIAAVLQAGAAITVYETDTLRNVNEQAGRLGVMGEVHLKIDTGMSRLGVCTPAEALQLARLVVSCPHVRLAGIFTHFANADRGDPDYTQTQFMRFMQAVEQLEVHNIHVPLMHCCNTAATIRYPEMHLDLVRVGIGLYGMNPSERVEDALELLEAMQLKTKIIAINASEDSRPRRLAELEIGYADGVFPSLADRFSFLVKGQEAGIVGPIEPHRIWLDVSDVPSASVGDEVVVFGRQGTLAITIPDYAAAAGTIGYEAVCAVSKRVPRIYKEVPMLLNSNCAVIDK